MIQQRRYRSSWRWLVAGLAIALAGCEAETKRPPQIEQLLQEARSLGARAYYEQALALIDSARSLAFTDPEALKQVTALSRELHLGEAESRLLELDRQIKEHDQALAPRLKDFIALHNKTYGTQTKYCHPHLNPETLGMRPHLRVLVDTTGVLEFVSVYVGERKLNHSSIRLSFSTSDASVTLPDVPHDDALNYRYSVGLHHWELVTYTGDRLEEALAFVKEGLRQRGSLHLVYLSAGREVLHYTLAMSELQALAKTLDLAAELQTHQALLREQAKYARRFARLSSADGVEADSLKTQ